MVGWVVEVVEGPDAGEQRLVERELEIGRKARGLRLHDHMASRHHARISADGKTVVLEDLGSTNGTLVNNEEVHSLAVLAAGDRIQVGVSVLELRRFKQVPARRGTVRPIPPALATPPQKPTYLPAHVAGSTVSQPWTSLPITRAISSTKSAIARSFTASGAPGLSWYAAHRRKAAAKRRT
jgi:pSer/pThr/pTyr-binding forkhead associated (FHA) protein